MNNKEAIKEIQKNIQQLINIAKEKYTESNNIREKIDNINTLTIDIKNKLDNIEHNDKTHTIYEQAYKEIYTIRELTSGIHMYLSAAAHNASTAKIKINDIIKKIEIALTEQKNE